MVRQKRHIPVSRTVPGEECSVRYCRGDHDGITLSPEGKKERRLCWKHWRQYCRETSGITELEEWLRIEGGKVR